jgi:predicted NBD/HSP70 family sugar kinase
MKKLNKSIILETIIAESPVSRAAISEKTGLNKATVSNLVTELIESQLVYETGPGASSGGRKPVMLLFNNEAGYAIGVDLGVNYILTMLTDLKGQIVKERRVPLTDLQYEQTLQQLIEAIRWAISSAPDSPYGIVGIGIGVPGLVDPNGLILSAPNLKWRKVDIKSAIEQEFELPVTIDNEANVGALGEKSYGEYQTARDMIYVSAGIGIGVGIVVNNTLYRGFSGFSGEMGHMTIHMDGLPCSCGNRGCWELYASENALLSRAAAYLQEQSQELSLDALVSLAERGDEGIIQLFREVGYYLGIGIANVINTFNPELVVIGNRLSLIKPWMEASMLECVEQRSLQYHHRRVQIVFSKLAMKSAAVGAAELAIKAFFAQTKASVEEG